MVPSHGGTARPSGSVSGSSSGSSPGSSSGSSSGRRPGRRPGPTETRQAILAAARELFAEKGYDATSLRAIARSAGVDPALVHHFFGNKEGVFVAAMRFPFEPSEMLARVSAVPADRLGETMVRLFLEVWGDPERRAPIVAMLRSAMTNEQAAAMMREFIGREVFGRIVERRQLSPLKANAAAGQMVGVVILRYVLRLEPLASATDEEVVELLAPTLQRYLA